MTAIPDASQVSLVPLIAEAERVLLEAVNYFGLSVQASRIVVTVQNAGRRNALGWFGADFWQNGKPEALHEINLCAEYLKTADIGELLLHELAHAENKQLGIQDCVRQRHNRKFKTMAERLGLVVKDPVAKYGYGITDIGDRGAAFLEEIAFKRELFSMCRLEFGPAKVPPGSRLVKVTCPKCGCTLRITQKWLNSGFPVCACGKRMQDATTEANEAEAAPDAEDEEPDLDSTDDAEEPRHQPTNQNMPEWFLDAWSEADATAAEAIGVGELDKRHVLAVLHLVRAAVAKRDPGFAEQLVAHACEATEDPAS